MKPKISVIVPIYNVAHWLENCLETLCPQAAESVEVILIDDGSTDISGDICDKYKALYPLVRVLHKDNGGLVSARKEGVRISKGEYITFVDGDDWVDNDWYQKALNYLKSSTADVITYGYIEESENISRPVMDRVDFGLYVNEDLQKLQNNVIVNKNVFFEWNILPNLWNKIIKKELIVNQISKISNKVTYAEDAICSYPCIWSAKSVLVLDKTPYHYVQRSGSMAKVFTEMTMEQLNNIYDCLKDGPEDQVALYLTYLVLLRKYQLTANGNMCLYPFNELNEGDKIVLYGMGGFGKSIYYWIKESKRVNVVACIDKKVENIAADFNLIEINELNSLKFDYVIISILNERIAESVKADLVKRGIAGEKILYIQAANFKPINFIEEMLE